MSITIRAIDCVHGRPAAGITAQLARVNKPGLCRPSQCRPSQGRTDDLGQVSHWDPEPGIERGIYRVELDIDGYFASLGITPFMPTAVVSFRITDSPEPCHVTVLITPYASLAYRAR